MTQILMVDNESSVLISDGICFDASDLWLKV